MVIRAWWLVGVVAVAWSCGPTTEKELNRRRVLELCAWKVRCGLISRSEEPACVTTMTAYFAASSARHGSDTDTLITAGRMSIDAAAAERCLAAYSKAACGQLSFPFPVCSGIYVGRVAAGEACETSDECAGGWCVPPAPDACGGTCVAWVSEGAACVSGECDRRSYCDQTGVCRPFRFEGRAAGAACNAGDQCAEGLYCAQRVHDGSGTCSSPIAEGRSCRPGEPCQSWLRCVAPSTSLTGTCVAVLDLGASCKPDLSSCALDAVCDSATRKCAYALGGRAGDACSSTKPCDETVLPRLRCEPSTMTCKALLAPGESCTTQQDWCSTSCDPVTSNCAPLAPWCK